MTKIEYPAHCEFSKRRQMRARRVLRQQIKLCPDFASNNLDADVIVEQVWNACAGLDTKSSKSSK